MGLPIISSPSKRINCNLFCPGKSDRTTGKRKIEVPYNISGQVALYASTLNAILDPWEKTGTEALQIQPHLKLRELCLKSSRKAELQYIPDEYKDPNGYFVCGRLLVIVILYNPNLVSDPPKSWEDQT